MTSGTSSVDASRVWIIDGGPVAPELPAIKPPTHVIAVDRGADHALALGLEVHEVIGDLDSVSQSTLGRLRARGAAVDEHPVDKDRSDLDLALARAAELQPAELVVVAGGGGRLDHALISALVLGRPEHARLDITAYMGDAVVIATIAGRRRPIPAVAGDTLSLLVVGGPARVRLSGVRWELHPDTIVEPGSSLGLSNIATVDCPILEVAQGVAMVVITPRRDSLSEKSHR